ncbi:hypothetical protein Tco_1096135 [Tanacetum coccineum]
MGIVVSTIHAAVKLHTPCDIGNVFLTYEPNNIEKGQKKIKESVPEAMKDVLSCINAEERIVVNDKHPKQMVIIGKQLPTSFKRKLFQIKCFLDAYKGYHHIQREKGDEDKTTIFTEKVLCYGKMPFGLKNAGATYQRALKEDMLLDIHESFNMLRSINMKLNPKKCSFGVEKGPFLGYLITKQRIKANPQRSRQSHILSHRRHSRRYKVSMGN